jgi:hypothetical protein
MADRLDRRGLDQLLQFVRGVGIAAPPPDDDTDQKGARRLLGAPGLDLEDGQLSLSVLRLTGRAGTTVEIACL